MADRARDLKIGLLSDASKFDLSDPADQLEQVGENAKRMGDDVDRSVDELRRLATQGADAQRELDRLNDTVRANDIDRLGTDAKVTASKVDDAFDKIASSSRAGATKVDASSDKMRTSLRGVGDEAGSTAREAAASFGSSGDIGDALQEVAANAPATLGPLGLAFGAVAGIGVGLFRSKTEALKERVSELVDSMIEAGGRLSKEFVDSEVLTLVKDGEAARLEELVDRYRLVGVTTRDVIRARAGDEEAIARVNAALDAESSRRKTSVDDMGRSEAAVAALRDGIDQGADSLRLAKEATEDYAAATVGNTETVKSAVETAKGNWDDLRGTYSRTIVGKVKLDANVTREAQIAWINADRYFQRNPITIRTRFAPTGQRPVRDVP